MATFTSSRVPLAVQTRSTSASLRIPFIIFSSLLFSSLLFFFFFFLIKQIFTMVLADDLTGNGYLDLLVTAKSGNIYCLDTNIPFHPGTAWYCSLLVPIFFFFTFIPSFLPSLPPSYFLFRLSPNQNRNSYTSGKHRGTLI